MANKLFIDIETYSSTDIRKSGHYKYAESSDFEILLICFALDDGPVEVIDLTDQDHSCADTLVDFWSYYSDPEIEKHAHNAAFERVCFNNAFPEKQRPIKEWHCTAIKAAYCGLPLALGQVSSALNLGEEGKKEGRALIRYFCMPCKPTKTNGGRTRNLPGHAVDKWDEFIEYCIADVVAERAIDRKLAKYKIPFFERENYIVDQTINDRGVKIDLELVQKAIEAQNRTAETFLKEAKELTGLENPNSVAQLKNWLKQQTGEEINSLAKDKLAELMNKSYSGDVSRVLYIRKMLSKSSVKKYTAMLNSVCGDGRVRGLFQFYGAPRTGRWAGRLTQVQNLPRNKMSGRKLDHARTDVKDYSDILELLYGDVNSILSQLIRTSFIGSEGKVLAVSDFSAIEARVLAWLAGEDWRLEVFKTHGKIYEASAAQMFGVPIESIAKR